MRAQRILEGHEIRRKVDCQACGQTKLEGDMCEAEVSPGKLCGWPQIELRMVQDGRLLIFMPLCPSTNARMRPVRMGRLAREIETDDARDYIASVSAQLKPMLEDAAKEWGWRPITYWRKIDLWLILPRTNCDAHNFGKILFDALEAGGLTFNDKYLLPQYRGVFHDAHEAMVAILA